MDEIDEPGWQFHYPTIMQYGCNITVAYSRTYVASTEDNLVRRPTPATILTTPSWALGGSPHEKPPLPPLLPSLSIISSLRNTTSSPSLPLFATLLTGMFKHAACHRLRTGRRTTVRRPPARTAQASAS